MWASGWLRITESHISHFNSSCYERWAGLNSITTLLYWGSENLADTVPPSYTRYRIKTVKALWGSSAPDTLSSWGTAFLIVFFKILFICFTERGKESETSVWERNICWLPLKHTPSGTKPESQPCALTRNRVCSDGARQTEPQQSGRGIFLREICLAFRWGVINKQARVRRHFPTYSQDLYHTQEA